MRTSAARRLGGVRSLLLLSGAILGGLSGGCTPDPITLTLHFPSEEALLYSESVRIFGFDVGPSEADLCPSLILQVIDQTNQREPALESGNLSVCLLRDGGFTFQDIGEGFRAFVGVVRAENGEVLLHGCIPPTELTAEQADLELNLTISNIDDYQDALEAIGPRGCEDFDQKCTRGCDPR